MNKETYQKMIETPEGGVSSSRVQSWAMQKFFFWFNILYVLLFALITYATMGIDGVQMGIVWVLAISWWVIDVILVLAIYTPKQLAKQLEVKQLIELAGKAVEKTIK